MNYSTIRAYSGVAAMFLAGEIDADTMAVEVSRISNIESLLNCESYRPDGSIVRIGN